MRISAKQWAALLKDTASSWSADFCPSMGAAISYYTLFSIAPLLLIVIALAGMAFGAEAARGEIFGQLRGLLGDEGAKGVESLLQAADRPGAGVVSTITGIVVLLLGATTVFNELQNALDRIWRAPARTRSSGIWSLLRTRLLSFGMVLGIAFLLMVSLVVSAALAALGKWWTPAGWEALMHIVDILLSFGLLTVMFALIYRYIPRVHVAWHDVWTGAAVTSLLFAIGKFAIGLYLGKSSVASSFGAAGSLVILIVWVYYSAQIFLFGAEFTWVFANEYGSRRRAVRTPAARENLRVMPEPITARPAANAAPARERRSLRRRHPFGSLGVAFVAGVTIAAAQSLIGSRPPARGSFRGAEWLHGLKRHLT